MQHAIAREFGFSGWKALKEHFTQQPALQRYERVAGALVEAYATGDAGSMRIVWDHFGHRRTWDVMRRYVRLYLGKRETPDDPAHDVITEDEARFLVARAQGFETWDALAAFAIATPPGKTVAAKAVGLFSSRSDDRYEGAMRTRDWEELLETLREGRFTKYTSHVAFHLYQMYQAATPQQLKGIATRSTNDTAPRPSASP